jgi:hypothetical protein
MGTVEYESGTAPFERRIGRRAPAEGLQVVWVEPRWGETTAETPPRQWAGLVDDVSVTGAGIWGPIDLPVGPGTKAMVRYRGRDTGVIVRRCQQTDDPDVARFGVEFAVLHPDLEARVHQLVGGPPPSAVLR